MKPETIVPQQFRDVESILKSACSTCGADLGVVTVDLDGAPAFAVTCSAHPGHLSVPVGERLAMEYDELVNADEVAYGVWQERQVA